MNEAGTKFYRTIKTRFIMLKVAKVIPQGNYHLEIYFSDNVHSTIDIKPLMKSGLSEKLYDVNYFKSVEIDEYGSICWDNGFDISPNFLKILITDD